MKRKLSVLLPVFLLLLSCGSGDDTIPQERPASSISGHAVDALILNGSVSVYAFSDGVKGDVLGTGVTDEEGFYSVDIQSPSQPVLIELVGGYYIEEATGKSVVLKDGQVLRAVTHYESGSPVTVMVTPFTNIAAGLAQYKIAQGVNVPNAVTEAATAVSSIVGVDILSTYPRNITDVNNTTAVLSDEHRYGFITAGISGLSLSIGKENDTKPHEVYTSIGLSQLFYDDVVADGLLDGKGVDSDGNATELFYGKTALTQDLYRRDIAAHILAIADDSKINKTGLVANDIVSLASRYATSGHAVYGGLPPVPLDSDGPTIVGIDAEEKFYNGIFDYAVSVNDIVGVKSVVFSFDGKEVDAAADPANPKVSINAIDVEDGPHTVLVTATDNLDNVSSRAFVVKIDNTHPIIEFTSDKYTNQSAYIAKGTYTDNSGIGIDTIAVNNEEIVFDDDGTWASNTLSLSKGANNINVVAKDLLGNLRGLDELVYLDTAVPSINRVFSDATYAIQGGTYTASLGSANETSDPLFIPFEKIELKGIPISEAGLKAAGFPFISLTARDPIENGVSSGDLVVKMQYSIDGTVQTAWRELSATSGQGGLVYLIPLVAEGLHPTWYNASDIDVHTIEISVTDKAGNTNLSNFAFKAKFDLQDIKITTPVSGGSVSVYAYDNGQYGGLIGKCTPSELGQCTVRTYTGEKAIIAEVTGGQYRELFSGQTPKVLENQILKSVVWFSSGDIDVALNPFTHIGVGLVDYYVSEGQPIKTAQEMAMSDLLNIYGIDVFETVPLNVTNATNATAALSDGHLYGLLLAGFSGYTQWASKENGAQIHRSYNSIALAQLMYADAKYDGLLNGAAQNALSFGSISLEANIYRYDVPWNTLQFVLGDKNATTLGVDELLIPLTAMADSGSPLFDGAVIKPLDQEGPQITMGIGADYVKGNYNVAPEVVDTNGLANVEIFVDNVSKGVFLNGETPTSVELDTTTYDDGDHAVKVVAVDVMGNETTVERSLKIDNTAPAFIITSSSVSKSVAVQVTGTVSDPHAGVKDIKVAGGFATINNDGTWTAMVSLNEGENTPAIILTDKIGNERNENIIINLDTVKPNYLITSNDTTIQSGYNVTGTVSDDNSGIATVTFDGSELNLNANAWSKNVSLSEGLNIFNIVVTDVAGNTKTEIVSVYKDSIAPQFSFSHGLATYSSNGTSTYQASLSGASATSDRLYVLTDKLELDNTGNHPNTLGNAGYPYYGIVVSDDNGNAGFTVPENIVVKMRYRQGSTTVKDWTTIDPITGSNDWYTIPLVNEYLTSSWSSVDENVIHTIDISATDDMGNTQNQSFQFRAYVVVPALSVGVSDVTSSFSATFASRSSLHNKALVSNEYTLTNPSPTANMYIKLSDGATHSASLSYQREIREHKARMQTSKEWRANFYTVFKASPNTTGWVNITSMRKSTNAALAYLNYEGASSIDSTWYVSPNWTTISLPAPTYGSNIDLSTDTLPSAQGPTSWVNKVSQVESPQITIADSYDNGYGCNVGAQYSHPSYDKQFAITWDYDLMCSNPTVTHIGWQERSVYAYVSVNGYPRNNLSSASHNYTFGTTGWSVTQNNGGSINTINGYYVVPPGESVIIKKSVTTPAMAVYNDTDVGSGSFSSYSWKYYDQTLNWSISRPITIKYRHGSSTGPVGVEKTMVAGTGSKAYSLGR